MECAWDKHRFRKKGSNILEEKAVVIWTCTTPKFVRQTCNLPSLFGWHSLALSFFQFHSVPFEPSHNQSPFASLPHSCSFVG